MTVNSAKLASLSMLMGCGDAGRLAALEKSLDPHARGEGVKVRRLRRSLVRGDDLVGGAAGHFGHAVELPGEAAGAGSG